MTKIVEIVEEFDLATLLWGKLLLSSPQTHTHTH